MVAAGGLIVQGIGAEATWLAEHVRVNDQVKITSVVRNEAGAVVQFDTDDSVVNGGPGLVTAGQVVIRPRADGLVHPDDPSFLWSWAVRRNPRTLVGVTTENRILLVTVDGKRPGTSVGMTLQEAGDLMRTLGAVTAMNLDGGGSTTMVVNGKVANSPTDPTGERPVGGAVVLVP